MINRCLLLGKFLHGCVRAWVTVTPSFPLRCTDPERAVPPGRLEYDLDADRLLLHTVQSAGAFGTLCATGVLRPDPALAEPLFADSYEFMYRQMAARLHQRERRAMAVGAYHPQGSRELLPSLARERAADLPGSPRAGAPVKRDGMASCPESGLGEMPMLPGESGGDAFARWEKASDAFEARLEAAGVERLSTPVRDWPADLKDEIERSWERIFDRGSYGPA